jgi:prolyl-tRNA editing enzyme YbaK/EbsC (Cys-tRNA(Pro) deacylase)
VPPLGHLEEIWTVVDRDLLEFDLVWAAAGTPKAVFSIPPSDLLRAVGGQAAQVAE